jgi:hypothetical protein
MEDYRLRPLINGEQAVRGVLGLKNCGGKTIVQR